MAKHVTYMQLCSSEKNLLERERSNRKKEADRDEKAVGRDEIGSIAWPSTYCTSWLKEIQPTASSGANMHKT